MARRRPITAVSKRTAVALNERAALARVTRLMAIPGPSGRERAAVEWIRDRLIEAGAKRSQISTDGAHRKSPFMDGGGEVGNLIYRMPGTLRGPRRMLVAHVDTVPLCAGCRPVRRGGRIVSAGKDTALGADNRAGCAVLLTAALEILKRGLPHPPLTFMWTVQEEVGLCGARFCSLGRLGNPGMVFNWDGGRPDRVITGATGACAMNVEIHGLASHAGGHPEEGISAAAIFGLAMAKLKRAGWHGLVRKGGVRGTSNVGVVRGGEATNVVMDRLEVRAEGRAHDRKLRKRIVDAYGQALREATSRVTNSSGRRGHLLFRAVPKYESFELDLEEPCVLAAEKAVRAVGLRPRREISNGGLDANWMTARGLPAVTLGAGIRNAHKCGESLEVKECLLACRVALLLATGE